MDESQDIVNKLFELVKVISGFPECINTSKKLYCNLHRSVKLLSPLFEELRSSESSLGDEEIRSLLSLKVALESAKGLLQSVNEGSKLFQALQMENIVKQFHDVTEKIEQALNDISFDKLNISEDVQELIELLPAQLKRAKERIERSKERMDSELYMDLNTVQNEKDPDPSVLQRLLEKLQLRIINDLNKESLALHEMVISSGANPVDWLEQMSLLLMKLKDFLLTGADTSKIGTVFVQNRSPVIPDDRAGIDALLQKLSNGNPEVQRTVVGQLRLLAKRNADNQVWIAEAGAIPVLIELLSSADPRTQEHSVTALLNLSVNETNKGNIVNAGAIPGIIKVLKTGSMEARENAAATIFSLSMIDEYKVAIGAAGAIPTLIDLLSQGSPRGKKDACYAIFNLSIYQGNKARVIRAAIVEPLMRLLKDASSGMVDDALAIMAILASHHEAKVAIGHHAEPMPILVDVLRTGSPRNRENAAAVLWSLCTGDIRLLKLLKELGAEKALKELFENGSDRAKRKAGNLLELILRMADNNAPA